MKVSRMKRMIGITGALLALTLTGTGCSILPKTGNSAAETPPAPPVKKVTEYDPAAAILDPEWEAVFGQDRTLATPIATAGLKILSVMFDEHPEYTLGGFVPADKDWTAVAASLKPLVNTKAMQYMESEWSADKTLPVMTSYRSKPDKDGVHSYTYTTEAGEKCTDAGTPYEYKNEAVTLTARPDSEGNQVPVFTSNVSVVLHCQEGIILHGQLYAWFPMVEVDGKWIMLDMYEAKPTGTFKKMLVVG